MQGVGGRVLCGVWCSSWQPAIGVSRESRMAPVPLAQDMPPALDGLIVQVGSGC
jgi:hypothetical protein